VTEAGDVLMSMIVIMNCLTAGGSSAFHEKAVKWGVCFT
jgi:hypothetical protein